MNDLRNTKLSALIAQMKELGIDVRFGIVDAKTEDTEPAKPAESPNDFVSVTIAIGKDVLHIPRNRLINVIQGGIGDRATVSARQSLLNMLYLYDPANSREKSRIDEFRETAEPRPDKASESLKLALRAHNRLDQLEGRLQSLTRDVYTRLETMAAGKQTLASVLAKPAEPAEVLNQLDTHPLAAKPAKPVKVKRSYTKRDKSFWKGKGKK
jgi:DNA-binding protein H-NS